VELAAQRADQLGEPPLDGHMDVLVLVGARKGSVLELLRDRVEALRKPAHLLLAQHPRRPQDADVRLRLRDVIRGQAPIEADRAVEAGEKLVRGAFEARHGRRSV
jgi:hypothetical protein